MPLARGDERGELRGEQEGRVLDLEARRAGERAEQLVPRVRVPAVGGSRQVVFVGERARAGVIEPEAREVLGGLRRGQDAGLQGVASRR